MPDPTKTLALTSAADLFCTSEDLTPESAAYNAAIIDLLGLIFETPVHKRSDRDMLARVLTALKRDMECDNPDCADEGRMVRQGHACRY